MKKLVILLVMISLLMATYSALAQVEDEEVQMFGLRGMTNIALGKQTAASSTYHLTFGSPNAVDGDLTTTWASNAGGVQWIYVDLGTPTEIDAIEIDWIVYEGVSYHATDYSILYFDVLDMNQIHTYTNVTGADGGLDTHPVTQKARYFAIYCSQSANGPYGINELRILKASPELKKVTIRRTAAYSGKLNYNTQTKEYSSFTALDYPNGEGDLIEGTSYYLDTRGYAGFSLASIPAGSRIVNARVYYRTYFPGPHPKGNCTLYKGYQHENMSNFIEEDYANNGWQTVYASMRPYNNDTQMMSENLNTTGLNDLISAHANGEVYKVGFRQDSGTRSRFSNSDIFIEIEYYTF